MRSLCIYEGVGSSCNDLLFYLLVATASELLSRRCRLAELRSLQTSKTFTYALNWNQRGWVADGQIMDRSLVRH